jgi:phosphoglycerol transferase MdoB-like AlkP superfamily enzyme
VEKEFVPLIIYAPEIEKNMVVTDTTYQMDIYPTLLHLLHQENYMWQGFGINLLDSNAKRKITPEKALQLSDAIIQNDYFKTIKR